MKHKRLYSTLAVMVIASAGGYATVTNLPSVEMVAYAKAQAVTLGSGTYTVGDDIKPGRYTITTDSGSGNLIDSDDDVNVILGSDATEDNVVTSYTVTLTKGAEVELDGLESVSFTPVNKHSYSTELGAGQWVVGKDIKPGKYKISATSGSGNLISDDGTINEILGTESDSDVGQVTSTTQRPTKGEVIKTDLQQITLTKK